MESPLHRNILGMRVDATSYSAASADILQLSNDQRKGYVCVANVHVCMETYDKPEFRDIVNNADIVTPDGMPLVWALKLLGIREATRVYGPTLTLHVCDAAEKDSVPIGLYGGTNESIVDFKAFLLQKYPKLNIAVAISPPFRVLTDEEQRKHIEKINSSGARILFVGLGCPKQEYWMAKHKDVLSCVMLGVGAAFDFHSGRVKQAPAFMQKIGLEWLFRLMVEPKRLWKRYFKHNPRFVIYFLRQLIFNNRAV